ncbi:MAG: M42 family peptidase [Oscillospiraceae bacterium]|jgi:endoglucanase|nr:M42 family peptidase [Oscillospiraceae bacterium]
MTDLLKELCAADGTSGDEAAVRQLIISKLTATDVTYRVDPLGNLLVEKKGREQAKNRVMFAAHMDEVGFVARYIDKTGFIKLSAVGGINDDVCFGRRVRFGNGVRGVIGGKPVHLLRGKDEADKQPKLTDLWCDTGVSTKEDLQVALGDTAVFDNDAAEFGEHAFCGKAVDDRLGCAILIGLLNSELPYGITCAFTTQEEIGTRGATTAAFTLKPDIAVVLETTTACDIPDTKGAEQITRLGEGVVVSFADGRTVYDRELYAYTRRLADKLSIPNQTKTKIAGGNDAGVIQESASGVKVIALSAPCRYLHTPSCVVNLDDFTATKRLACALAEELPVYG